MKLSAAFWAKQTPDSFWNLWIAVDTEDQSDLIVVYVHLAAELKKSSAIQMSRMMVVPTTDRAADYLNLARNVVSDGRLLEMGAESLKPLGWHAAILYPKFSPMNAIEVAGFLARELNRAGDAVPVTLTLADGQNVRGYPLAIRKSTLGGALVELADPETKLKGQEIPLDHISSVTTDFLAS